MGEGKLCNGELSFMPMPLVSRVKNQSKLLKSFLAGVHCLDRVIFNLTLMISVRK